jgi:hypothetical protein
LSEDARAIRSPLSAEESGLCADSRESGSAPQNAGEPRPCSNVARGPTPAKMLRAIEAAIEPLEAGDVDAARRGCVRWLRPSGHKSRPGRTWRLV